MVSDLSGWGIAWHCTNSDCTLVSDLSGWGISWYVNGSLIPELRLKRGSTYTFIVEGGNDPSDLADYHPFYITSSELGGRLRNTNEVTDLLVDPLHTVKPPIKDSKLRTQ